MVPESDLVGDVDPSKFDDKVFDDKAAPNGQPAGPNGQSNPWAVFQFGFSAYKSGHKDQAVEAYRYAAENGQIGATWKLARMYAQGDGVARNDYEAFKFFTEIVQQDVEPGSPEESYIADALVALGSYLRAGIPGSPVEADPAAAQDYYTRAAANYRNANAQFELAESLVMAETARRQGVDHRLRLVQRADDVRVVPARGIVPHCGDDRGGEGRPGSRFRREGGLPLADRRDFGKPRVFPARGLASGSAWWRASSRSDMITL